MPNRALGKASLFGRVGGKGFKWHRLKSSLRRSPPALVAGCHHSYISVGSRSQAAELARAQLHAQAIADRQAAINQKLRDEGAKLLSPVDFDLDWRDLRSGTHKVAIEGKYMEADDVEGLMLSNNDMPLVRLYTDDASRDARKAMLECRNSNYAAASCQLIIAGTVVTCIRNKGEYNEKEVPCLHVDDAFVDPTIDR